MEMGSYPTLDWHNTTDSSLRWLREYFLFSFIKPRNRQKTACQTGVSRFTAKEMGKSFLRTYFIWNTFSKITKSCVFLPHNPFISYLDKKSYFFLILDILPSSSRLQKDKILRHFKARRQRIAWNWYFFICQCINQYKYYSKLSRQVYPVTVWCLPPVWKKILITCCIMILAAVEVKP